MTLLKYRTIPVRSSRWCVYTVHVNMTKLKKAATHCVTNARKRESYLFSRGRESYLLGLDLNSFWLLFLSSFYASDFLIHVLYIVTVFKFILMKESRFGQLVGTPKKKQKKNSIQHQFLF